MIELQNIRKVFNEGRPNEYIALHDLSLTIAAHQVTALTGPSGSGKTTLLSLLGCMARPTAGRIVLAWARDHQSARALSHRHPAEDLWVYLPAIQSP